jgi:hypothetical protein
VDVGFSRANRHLVLLAVSVSGAVLADVLLFLPQGCTTMVLELPGADPINSAVPSFGMTETYGFPTCAVPEVATSRAGRLAVRCCTAIRASSSAALTSIRRQAKVRGTSSRHWLSEPSNRRIAGVPKW